jgi:hypothetical protein
MEDPAILVGIPMIIIGSIGLLVAAVAMASGGESTPQRAASRAGWTAFIGLAWLTIVEYLIAISMSFNFFVLVFIAAVKTGLILNYFMHVMRVRRAAGESH